ncbi:MAG: hypothetical protein H0V04_04105 [Chloroflexi bacterium]|nr:hypothetical protein [Chloroflexota bacterium]HEV8054494.1 hypothetical protein [Candidatus Limnocylindrales bacterium]
MEKGALGDPREAVLDTLYAEAKQVLSQTANQLHTLTERLREAHAFDVEAWQQRSEHDGSTREGTVELARLTLLLDVALLDGLDAEPELVDGSS